MADTSISNLTATSPATAAHRIPIAITPFGSGNNGYITPALILSYGTSPISCTTLTTTSTTTINSANNTGYDFVFGTAGGGASFTARSGSTPIFLIGYHGVAISGTIPFGWQASAPGEASANDCGLSRLAANSLAVGNGTVGSFAGRLKLTSTIVAATTVAALNASPTIGEISTVNDALAVTAKGATVAAGGSAVSVVVWNGANWVGI